MSNIGIIAGGGNLPIAIGRNLIKKNFNVSFFVIDEFFDSSIYKDLDYKIAGYAATSKSTTVLYYCNIDHQFIDFICDTTPEKIGKFSPGMHIPIKDMSYFHNNLTDCVYLFAWNHKNEILDIFAYFCI